MTKPTDYFLHPRPKSDQSQHSQESGDDGLSSNMEHKFSDRYTESASPVVDTGSNVRPIPKEEEEIFTEMAGKMCTCPGVGHAAGEKALPVSAEEGVSKPATQAVMQKNSFPPRAALSEGSQREEAVEALPVAITELAGEEGCAKMDSGENPAKLKGPKLVPGGGKNRNHHRRRAAGKYRKMNPLWRMTVIWIAVSAVFLVGAQAAAVKKPKCYTCMEKDRCPKLKVIFEKNLDTRLYNRDVNPTFPECSATCPPRPKCCVVCSEKSNISIFCSGDIEGIEVEASDGGIDISAVCEVQLPSCHVNVGLIVGIVFAVLLVVVGAVLLGVYIYSETLAEKES